MAGIGFELRKILSKDSYTSTMRAYLYAGLISSGPWVLSIISVMLIGVLSLGAVLPETLIDTKLLLSGIAYGEEPWVAERRAQSKRLRHLHALMSQQ